MPCASLSAGGLHGEEIYDQEAIREWVREARVFTSLPELVRGYLELAQRRRDLTGQLTAAAEAPARRKF